MCRRGAHPGSVALLVPPFLVSQLAVAAARATHTCGVVQPVASPVHAAGRENPHMRGVCCACHVMTCHLSLQCTTLPNFLHTKMFKFRGWPAAGVLLCEVHDAGVCRGGHRAPARRGVPSGLQDVPQGALRMPSTVSLFRLAYTSLLRCLMQHHSQLGHMVAGYMCRAGEGNLQPAL